MSRYLNPCKDFGFKKLFGEEANKDLLVEPNLGGYSIMYI